MTKTNINFIIRKAEIKDEEELYNIVRRAMREVCSKKYTQEQINTWLLFYDKKWVQNTVKNELNDLYVAEKNHHVIGFGLNFMNIKYALTHNLTPRAYLQWLFVDPDYLRQGIGTSLLLFLEHIATQRGCVSIYVSAFLNSISFFHKRGYKMIQKGPLLLWKGVAFDGLSMEKTCKRSLQLKA